VSFCPAKRTGRNVVVGKNDSGIPSRRVGECEVTAADHEVAKAGLSGVLPLAHARATLGGDTDAAKPRQNSDPRGYRRFPAAFQINVCYRKVKLPEILHQHDVGFGELVLHVDERLAFRRDAHSPARFFVEGP
jgi:hypothetical protein